MPLPLRSSRRRYQDYRAKIKKRSGRKDDPVSASGGPGHGDAPHMPGDPKPHKPRSRSFGKLFLEFWGQLRGHQGTIAFTLVAATISTLVGLMPLYGTKIVFDSVLADPPLPTQLPAWLSLPSDPRRLLGVVAVAMVALAAVSEAFGIW